MMKTWLSILFFCAIIFSSCVTMAIDKVVVNDNQITYEQVDDYLLAVEKSLRVICL